MISSKWKYWNEYANRYSRIYSNKKSGLERWVDHLLRKNLKQRFNLTFCFLDNLKGKSLLDVGCGTGLYLVQALRHGASQVTGLDPSIKMLDIARKALNEAFPDSDRWCLIKGCIEEFNTKQRFDVIIAIGVFDYLESPEVPLNRLRASNNEVVICSFPHPYAWRVPFRWLWLRFRGLKPRLFTLRKIKELMNKTGLRTLELRRLGPIYWIAAEPSET